MNKLYTYNELGTAAEVAFNFDNDIMIGSTRGRLTFPGGRPPCRDTCPPGGWRPGRGAAPRGTSLPGTGGRWIRARRRARGPSRGTGPRTPPPRSARWLSDTRLQQQKCIYRDTGTKLLTSEIYSRCCEHPHDEDGEGDAEAPLLVGVHLARPPHLDVVVCGGGAPAEQLLLGAARHAVLQ